MKLSIVERLSEEDFDYLFKWDDFVFPIEGKGMDWSKTKYRIVAIGDSGLPIAHIGFAPFELELDNSKNIPVVGVGCVLVRPEHQGKHILNKLFKVLFTCQEASSISSLFALFCPERLESYYQRHGFKKFLGSYTFTQKGKTTSSDKFIFMYKGGDISANAIHIDCNPW